MYNIHKELEQFRQITEKIKQNLVPDEDCTKRVIEIRNLISKTKQQIQDCKIQLNFLGVISSGKSTLINTLIGHPVLKMSNQSSTKSFIKITHLDQSQVYCLQENEVQIVTNKIGEAYQFITHTQDDVSILLNSAFHSTLDAELRNKVQIIDTPGISLDSPQKNQQIIRKLKKINQDPNIISIYVLVVNYQNSETEIKLLKALLDEDDQSLSQSFSCFLEQTERKSSEWLIVLNKYDERDQNDSYELVRKIQENNRHIYRLSALDAFYYKLTGNDVVEKFYNDCKNKYNLNSKQEAENFLKEKIKNNPNIVNLQDYTHFANHLTSKTELQVKNKFLSTNHYILIAKLNVLDLVSQQIDLSLELSEQFIFIDLLLSIETQNKSLISEFLPNLQLQSQQERLKYFNSYVEYIIQEKSSQLLKQSLNKYCLESLSYLTELNEKCISEQNKIIQQYIHKLKQYFGNQDNISVSFVIIKLSGNDIIQIIKSMIEEIQNQNYPSIPQFDSLFQIKDQIGQTDSQIQIFQGLFMTLNHLFKKSNSFHVSNTISMAKRLIMNEYVSDSTLIRDNFCVMELRFQRYLDEIIQTHTHVARGISEILSCLNAEIFN